MQEGKDVLNGPVVESGDPKSVDEEVQKIKEENEDIKKAYEALKREMEEHGFGVTPEAGISTSPHTSPLDASWADGTPAIDGKCM
jgi:hypothetical protein